MRTPSLFAIAIVAAISGCSKDTSDADPCARAVENVKRLTDQGTPEMTTRFEGRFDRGNCHNATPEQLSCVGYASSIDELKACGMRVIGGDDVSRAP